MAGRKKRSIAVDKNVVRRLMRERMVSEALIAYASGYSTDTVDLYIRRGEMSPEMFKSVVNLLNTTPEELRGEE